MLEPSPHWTTNSIFRSKLQILAHTTTRLYDQLPIDEVAAHAKLKHWLGDNLTSAGYCAAKYFPVPRGSECAKKSESCTVKPQANNSDRHLFSGGLWRNAPPIALRFWRCVLNAYATAGSLRGLILIHRVRPPTNCPVQSAMGLFPQQISIVPWATPVEHSKSAKRPPRK